MYSKQDTMATENRSVSPSGEDLSTSLKQMAAEFRESGELTMSVFNDEELFELERKEIFEKEWILLGHESEIEDPGDYVVRQITDNSVIVSRDEDGEIHVFFNVCRHQGREICHGDMGNTSHFRCPYHGWTYKNDGELIGVPYEERAYGDEGVEKTAHDLREPAQYDTYNGLIFACQDPDAEPLDEYLGDFKFYLDYYVGRSGAGMEVIGPQRRVVDANWKLGVINTMGDHYHALITHQSVTDTEMMAGGEGALSSKPRYHVHADAGGLEFNVEDFFNGYYSEELQESFKEGLSDEQWDLMTETGYRPVNMSLLPNSNFNNLVPFIEDEPVPLTYMRVWRPIGPDKSEVYTWVVVEKDAPQEFKDKVERAYVSTFGVSGILEQDDLSNWASVTKMGGESETGRTKLKFDMRMDDDDKPSEDWAGPGTAYQTSFNEANSRYFFNRYFDSLTGEDDDE